MNRMAPAKEFDKKFIYNDAINELLPSAYMDHLTITTIPVPVHLREYIENYAILDNRNPLSSKDWLILPDLNPYLVCYDCETQLNKDQVDTTILYIGPRTKSIRISRASRRTTILIRFKPFGIKPFIPCNPEALVNSSIRVQQLWQEKGEALASNINKVHNSRDRLKILEDFLVCTRNRLTYADPLTSRLLQFIYDDTANHKVKDLVKVTGVSERYLLSTAIRNTGLSPKKMIRIHRLLEVIRSIGNTSSEKFNWAGLAYQHRYADQSHMIDDFIEFLELSPEKLVNQFGKADS
jgi:AraC-like DNA-binding protein